MSFSAADLKPDLKPVAIKDPFCDPDNPVVVQWKDVEKAMENIKKSVIRTPFKVMSCKSNFRPRQLKKSCIKNQTICFKTYKCGIN